MKKSKIIQLVLVSASLASCNTFVGTWQTTPPANENASNQDTNYHPYWDYNNYNWYFNQRYWCRLFYNRRGHVPQVVHYGPRYPIGGNVRHHSPITRGGFGGTGHNVGGHSAVS
jgi:hypothetical protein